MNMNFQSVIFGAVLLFCIGITSIEACHIAYRRVSGHTESMIQTFGKCMSDSAGKEFRWLAITRFAVEDTNWYFDVSNIRCSRERDTDQCWEKELDRLINSRSRYSYHVKRCIKEYTRQESSFTAHFHSNSAALAGELLSFSTNHETTTIEKTQEWVPTPTQETFISEKSFPESPSEARTGRGKRSVELSDAEKLLLLLMAKQQQAIRSGNPSQQPTYTTRKYQFTSPYSSPTIQSANVAPQHRPFLPNSYQPNPKIQKPSQATTHQVYNYPYYGREQAQTNPSYYNNYNGHQQHSNEFHNFQQQPHGNNVYHTTAPPVSTTKDPFVFLLEQHHQPTTTSTPPPTAATNSPMSQLWEFLKQHKSGQYNANQSVDGLYVSPIVTGEMCDRQAEERFKNCALSALGKVVPQRRSFLPNINPVSMTDMSSIFSFFLQYHSGCSSFSCTQAAARSSSAASPTCLPTMMLNLVKNDSKLRNIFLSCAS